MEEEAPREEELHGVGGVGAEGEVIRTDKKKERKTTKTNVDNFTSGILILYSFAPFHLHNSLLYICIRNPCLFFISFYTLPPPEHGLWDHIGL